jgi:hypothetical protein
MGLVLALSVLMLPACKREGSSTTATETQPPAVSAPVMFHITGVDLGTSIDAGNRVNSPASTFAPGDTIYASVRSEGSGPRVELIARWSYEDDQLVEESRQVIIPSGPAVTEFHVAKPDGWPTGRYQLEVSANGAPVATKEFSVQ